MAVHNSKNGKPHNNGARSDHRALSKSASLKVDLIDEALPALSVREQLSGKHILLTGVTGFVGKVLLTLIAKEIRDVRRISVLIRKNKRYSSAQERFDEEVMTSEPFMAIGAAIGEKALRTWAKERVTPITGDITQDQMGISDDVYREITQEDPLELVIHCAGNVSFDPPLNEALEVNTLGVAHKLELARDAGCPLVHMSTCFVTGKRSGPIHEPESIFGFTPKGVDFDVEREVQEAINLISRWRDESKTQAMDEFFREKAVKTLEDRGLNAQGVTLLEREISRCRTRWVDENLRREGMERALRWGWTNTYTYTKSMGEQLTLSRAKEFGVPVSIVRPAIVESSHSFPFPGWNEGINTCAPIVYLYWKGQRFTPSNPDNILDVIPVDWVCRGTLLAAAELLEGLNRKLIYQFCTGGDNPLQMRRAIELTNLAWRGHYNKDFNFFERHLMRNLETLTVDAEFYNRRGAPAVKKATSTIRSLLKGLPKSAKRLTAPLDKGLKTLEKGAEIADTIFKVFAPFILENNPKFLALNTKHASARLIAEEREAFSFPVESLDWRDYWINIHMAGLQKWVFGELDDKMKRSKRLTQERDLVSLFHRVCSEYEHQRALHLFDEDGIKVTYTYGDLWRGALTVAGYLRDLGIKVGDVVVLMSPNEPAWPMVYLGALLADATIAPVDPEMSPDEVARILKKSKARALIHHESYPQDSALFEREGIPLTGATPLHIADLSAVFKATPLESALSLHDRSEQIASLLFTSGTTGDPKGVMLSHGNFCALLSSLHGVFKVNHKDRFLSVLPLFHTFEFSGGFLMPASVGAQITYLSDLEGPILRRAMKQIKPTGIIGIPALWDVLQKRIETQVKDRGEAARIAFKASVKLNRNLRKYGINLGPLAFSEVHDTLGGKIRYLISGGAALNDSALEIFEGLGFELLEGYGLTEAAPVLSVRRPGQRKSAGSVGRPLPGITLKINNPNEHGVGEVIASADTIMSGYLDQPEATAEVLREGWLHTGDLGSIDHRGNLTLAGRSKEMIVTSSGKNVYPDELEPLFGDHEYIDEISIVGIPDPQGDERVAALIVLKEDAPEDAQIEVKAHLSTLNALRPDHQRLRMFRFWPDSLPRTATRKVKRSVVRAELIRLLEVGKVARRAEAQVSAYEPTWLYGALASLSGLEVSTLTPESDLTSDLGLSSLQVVELRMMIEEQLQRSVNGDQVASARLISDLAELATKADRNDKPDQETSEVDERPLWRDLPTPVRDVGRRLIDYGRGAAYSALFKIDVKGRSNIPSNQQVIVISNHASHLDIGLIKESLGVYGDDLCVLAAQDYFFDNEYKEAIFGQLTQLVPIDRTAPLERGFRPAEMAISSGHSVLMYPEGTRSMNGELQEFKAGIGYLQQKTGLAILPLYLRGTHKALPKGSALPKVGRTLSVRIGRLIEPEVIDGLCQGKKRHEAYQQITEMCKEAIEALRDHTLYPWEVTEDDRVKKSDGAAPLFEYLEERFDTARVDQPITWYFSLGDQADSKWTLAVDKASVRFYPGRPQRGQADCVLKTDMRIFERMVREGYIPSFAEFAEGKVKTNNPTHLRAFQSIFSL